MKALIYQGVNKKEFTEKPKPTILKPTDVVVKVKHTTICGTDLHILKGDVPEVPLGLTLGHEGVGIIDEVGSAVQNFKKGDEVIISCITSCSKCEFCKKNLQAHCVDGGWILGHYIDGTQAEYVRVPHADNSLHHIPKDLDKKSLVMLSDIFPTGFEIGVLHGEVFPGSTIAIIGAGPIGLAALLTAQFYSPAEIIVVDLDDSRLEVAKKFGATKCINSSDGKAVENIMKYTNSKGVDIVIEAVGITPTFDICQKIIAPGGTIALAGVFGKSVDFHIEKLWIKNIKLTTGLVSATSTQMLLKTVKSKKLNPSQLITHNFKFDEFLKAYDTFENASDNKALKVIISS